MEHQERLRQENITKELKRKKTLFRASAPPYPKVAQYGCCVHSYFFVLLFFRLVE